MVDEALSVGDAQFQAKCFERFRVFKEHRAKRSCFVTHSLEPRHIVLRSHPFLLEQRTAVRNISHPQRRQVNAYRETANNPASGQCPEANCIFHFMATTAPGQPCSNNNPGDETNAMDHWQPKSSRLVCLPKMNKHDTNILQLRSDPFKIKIPSAVSPGHAFPHG